MWGGVGVQSGLYGVGVTHDSSPLLHSTFRPVALTAHLHHRRCGPASPHKSFPPAAHVLCTALSPVRSQVNDRVLRLPLPQTHTLPVLAVCTEHAPVRCQVAEGMVVPDLESIGGLQDDILHRRAVQKVGNKGGGG